MGEPLFVSAPMPRTMEQWRNMIPEAVCDGSPAQILYCVRDAQITIVSQARKLSDLRVALDEIARLSEAVGMDGLSARARKALAS
jgi:hypothetical protein